MKLWLNTFICLVLVACQSSDVNDWPASLPAREYFVAAYYADVANQQYQTETEYLGWIRSFYQGNLIAATGWSEMQAMVIATAAPADRRRLHRQLDELGALIAAEWAKDNAGRAIDSRMLALWGSILQLAVEPRQQRQAIAVIAGDVDALLSGKLSRSEIQDARYERMLDMELFSGF